MTNEERPPKERVVLDQPETQNLLGLLLRNMLEVNLADEANYNRIRGTKGDVQVQAGDMVITLRLDGQGLTIISGAQDQPKASVRGGMGAFLNVARGGGVVGPVLSGHIKIKGNPLLLLKLMPLLRAPKEVES